MNINRDYFWFRLFKARGIGPKSLTFIAKTLETEQLYPEMLPTKKNDLSTQFPKLAKILNGKIREEDREKVLEEYRQLRNLGIEIMYPGHSDFLSNLLEISPVFFLQGQRKHLTADSAAIVGSRNVSYKGIRHTEKLAADLAGKGINVVSGYAKGIDTAAHLGALEAEGTTTTVLPYGIREFHLKKAFKQFDWKQNVLIVSQFDPYQKWLARNAMIRNKFVCALSKVVVVIESGPERDEQGKMSGTFNAAKTALEMNLPLFVLDPSCLENPPQGNAELIALGGKIINSADGAEQINECITKKTENSVENTFYDDVERLPLVPDSV